MSAETGAATPGEDETRTLMRGLVLEALDGHRSGRSSKEAIRRRTRAVCASARAQGLPIERVLVTLKHEWQESAEARRLGRFDATNLLEQMVTLCIAEYYADGGRSGDGKA